LVASLNADEDNQTMSKTELIQAHPSLAIQLFEELDANSDDRVSIEEWHAFLKRKHGEKAHKGDEWLRSVFRTLRQGGIEHDEKANAEEEEEAKAPSVKKRDKQSTQLEAPSLSQDDLAVEVSRLEDVVTQQREAYARLEASSTTPTPETATTAAAGAAASALAAAAAGVSARSEDMLLSLLQDSRKSQEEAQRQLLQLTAALTTAQLDKSSALQEAAAIKTEFKAELMLTKAEVIRLEETLRKKDNEVERLAGSVGELGTLREEVGENRKKEAFLVAKMDQLQQAREVQDKLEGASKALANATQVREMDLVRVLVCFKLCSKYRPLSRYWQLWWRMAFTERAIRVVTENISEEAEAYVRETLQMHGIGTSGSPPPQPAPAAPPQAAAPPPGGASDLMNTF